MEQTWELSVLDKLYGTGYVSCCFCFPLPDPTAKDAAVSRVRKGVEATLIAFPMLAGTLTTISDDNGCQRTVVRRHGDSLDAFDTGALVVDELDHNAFPFSYEQYRDMGFPTKELPAERATLPYADPSKQPPVCVIKISFIPGGLILAIVVERSVLDGSSAAMALGHIARHTWDVEAPTGSAAPASCQPPAIFLPQLGDPAVAEDTIPEYDFGITPVFVGLPRSTGRVFSFPLPTLLELKKAVTAHMRSNGLPGWVSTNNCLNALIWVAVLRARAANLSSTDTVKFAVAVDVRNRVDPPVPNEYLRNTVLFALARTCLASFPDTTSVRAGDGSSVLLHSSIANITHAAMAIRAAIDAVDTQFVRTRVAFLSRYGRTNARDIALAALRAMDVARTGLFLSSAVSFMANASYNFGRGGQCADVSRKPYVGFPGTLYVLPGGGQGDRAVDLMIELDPEQMASVVQDKILQSFTEAVVE